LFPSAQPARHDAANERRVADADVARSTKKEQKNQRKRTTRGCIIIIITSRFTKRSLNPDPPPSIPVQSADPKTVRCLDRVRALSAGDTTPRTKFESSRAAVETAETTARVVVSSCVMTSFVSCRVSSV